MSLNYLYTKFISGRSDNCFSERKRYGVRKYNRQTFDVLMNSIIQIVKDSETKDEAVEKLHNLVKGKEN